MSSSSHDAQSTSETPAHVDVPVLSHILTPGSSLHPTFLLIVDAVFAFLLLVLILLAFITGGNPHFFVLICISLGLWASVKWFVNELRQTPLQNGNVDSGSEESKKDI